MPENAPQSNITQYISIQKVIFMCLLQNIGILSDKL